MLRNFIITGLFCCAASTLFSRSLQKTRYKDPVYTDIRITQNISYVSDIPDGVKPKYYRLDLYEPENDSSVSRPLIIWIHGGGFKFGKKRSRGIPVWSKQFAQRGYVCAAINYRLSKQNTLSDREALIRACRDAMEDAGKVIDFFKKNQALYRIDTGKIILAGNSAGGMVSLQAVYSNDYLMASENKITDAPPGDDSFNTGRIAAVINFWGGIFDSTWLRNAHVPIVSVHGNKDRIVPADNPGKGICGSIIIHRVADVLHIPNSVKIYNGFAHELQKPFNPLWAGKAARTRWTAAGNFAADFLYQELFVKKTAGN